MGGDTAGTLDPNWPNAYSMLYVFLVRNKNECFVCLVGFLFVLLPRCPLFGDWSPVQWAISLPSLVCVWLVLVWDGLVFFFLASSVKLSLSQPLSFLTVVPVFSCIPLLWWWTGGFVTAWLMAKVIPPQHFAQTPKNMIDGRCSSTFWFYGNGAHWINQWCGRYLCPMLMGVLLVPWYRIFSWSYTQQCIICWKSIRLGRNQEIFS